MLTINLNRITPLIVGFVLAANSVAAPPTVEQVDKALDIAEKAAGNGLFELSQKAVRRSLQFGPPTVSLAEDKTTIRISGARVDTSRKFPPTPLKAIQLRIPQLVLRLAQEWQGDSDPRQIYETLHDIVLPPHRRHEAFLYSLPGSFDDRLPHRFPVRDSIGQRLIEIAIQAGTLDQLHKELSTPSESDSAQRALLTLLVAHAKEDADLWQRQSRLLVEILQRGSDRESVDLIAATVVQFGLQAPFADASADVLQACASVAAARNRSQPIQNSSARAIVLAAARAQFAIERTQAGVDLLKVYRSLKVKGRFGLWTEEFVSHRNYVVAEELYSRGLEREAREMLSSEFATAFERRDLSPFPLEPFGDDKPIAIIPAKDIADVSVVEQQIWVCVLDTQAKESRLLFTLPDFQTATDAVVSPDGEHVAIVATLPGEAVTSDMQIYVADNDGTAIRSLGRGTLPSWSPNGHRIAFSSYSPTRGIWTMRADGTLRRLIDEAGWGAAWSPDGRRIAYTIGGPSTAEIVVFDIADQTFRSISKSFAQRLGITRAEQLSWSPDAKQLAFSSPTNGGGGENAQSAVLTINVDGPIKTQSLGQYEQPMTSRLAWNPSGGSIVVALPVRLNAAVQLHQLETSTLESPSRLPGQFDARRNFAASWLPDGKTLVYLSAPAKQ